MAERVRPIQMKFYVDEDEQRAIHQKMNEMEITNQSHFLRKMALEGMMFRVDYSCFNDIAKSLESISRNINQIAKRVNIRDEIYTDDIRTIKNSQEEIWRLLQSILSKLR